MNEAMRSFESVMSRAREAIGESSWAGLARAMGMTTNAFANLKKRQSIPYEKLSHLADSREVSLDWILTGKGVMRRHIQIDAANDSLSPRQRAVLTMFESLSEEDQREILRDVEEKKRLGELEARVKELEKLKNLG